MYLSRCHTAPILLDQPEAKYVCSECGQPCIAVRSEPRGQDWVQEAFDGLLEEAYRRGLDAALGALPEEYREQQLDSQYKQQAIGRNKALAEARKNIEKLIANDR